MATGDGPRRWTRVVAWVLFGATVIVQIIFPYTDGGTLSLTVASVLLLTAAVIVDVGVTRGPGAAMILVVVAGGGGLLAETIGVHTGLPFGTYSYSGTLGPEVLGVPALVPCAWIMMAWPALAAARRLVGTRRRWATAAVAALALTSWDVFLDPQMVDQGHWEWRYPTPAIPGVEGIPVTNFVGWMLVSLVMMVLLDRFISRGPSTPPPADALPIAVYLWTYVSSVLAHAVFFGRPPVALVGGLIMGVVAVPLAINVIREVRDAR
ncbi:carotenoid biosynthesis protein [Gordonia insulae]|nr:carotenoid biosynthesis protein [Gordonia insulae]